MDALHITAMTGEMVSQMSLSSHVGRGSSGHCFAGNFLMRAATSSADTGLKVASGNQIVMDFDKCCFSRMELPIGRLDR